MGLMGQPASPVVLISLRSMKIPTSKILRWPAPKNTQILPPHAYAYIWRGKEGKAEREVRQIQSTRPSWLSRWNKEAKTQEKLVKSQQGNVHRLQLD